MNSSSQAHGDIEFCQILRTGTSFPNPFWNLIGGLKGDVLPFLAPINLGLFDAGKCLKDLWKPAQIHATVAWVLLDVGVKACKHVNTALAKHLPFRPHPLDVVG